MGEAAASPLGFCYKRWSGSQSGLAHHKLITHSQRQRGVRQNPDVSVTLAYLSCLLLVPHLLLCSLIFLACFFLTSIFLYSYFCLFLPITLIKHEHDWDQWGSTIFYPDLLIKPLWTMELSAEWLGQSPINVIDPNKIPQHYVLLSLHRKH